MNADGPMAEELRALARRALGPEDGDRLVDLARPAVRFAVVREPVGRSRLGGVPLLDDGHEWPRWGDRPLSFVAVIDGGDVAGFETGLRLPGRGLLNLFYEADEQQAWGFDPDHGGGWRVVVADPQSARERARPDAALEFTACGLGTRQVLTVPDAHEEVVDDLLERHREDLYELVEQWAERHGLEEPHHQLGGWPNLVQNPLQVECELASNGVYCGDGTAYSDPRHEHLRRSAASWRLLLQIDSDDDAGWMWGDCGSLYYCVRGPDATPAALDAAWMILQCS